MENFRFCGALWVLGATYTVHLRLTGKLVVDFLQVNFARCFRFVTIHVFDRQTDGRTASSWLDCVAFNAVR